MWRPCINVVAKEGHCEQQWQGARSKMGSDADNKGPTRNVLKRHTITTTMHNNDVQTSENMKSQQIEMRNCRACAVMHVNKQTSILKKLLGLHPKTKETQHVEISCVGGTANGDAQTRQHQQIETSKRYRFALL